MEPNTGMKNLYHNPASKTAGKTRSKSSLFLIEMIFVTVFFSFASAVCMKLFTKAYLVSKDNVAITQAVTYATSMAETFKVCDGDIERTARLLEITVDEDGRLIMPFSIDWDRIASDEEKPYYEISGTRSEKDGLAQLIIEAREDGRKQPLYELEIRHFIEE
ncbi:MAG: hypothetical protein FWE80_08425 [Oscillospiraceae bacterium]|nr:hypothetical protein [Oscillospiraceae bacterium]